jgi:predicted acetyltransferase
MSIEKLIIRPLNIDDEIAFKLAVSEFKNKEPDFEFAFKYEHSMPFSDYVQMLERWALGLNLPDKFVPNTFLVGVIGNRIVSRISIRHELNDFLASVGGHVGYGVVPSERKKGYGTKMLNLVFPVAANLGISRLLITCDDDNLGSIKIIENNGGIFESLIRDTNSMKMKKRYWIELKDNSYDHKFKAEHKN